MARGSDERNYCWPGGFTNNLFDENKVRDYKEYHTSDDNLDFISPEGLQGGYEINLNFLKIVEIQNIFVKDYW